MSAISKVSFPSSFVLDLPKEKIEVQYQPNGSFYEGELKEGFRNGLGRMLWVNGSCYIGHWQKGVQEGSGSFYLKTEKVLLKGTFIEGVLEGDGEVHQLDSNTIFKVVFLAGKIIRLNETLEIEKSDLEANQVPQPEEMEIDLEKQIADTTFADWGFSEETDKTSKQEDQAIQGTLFYSDLGEYKGGILKGLPHGPGRWTLLNGSVLEGVFIKGELKDRLGKLNYLDGEYDGEILDFRPHGKGAWKYPDGFVAHGFFYNGILLSGIGRFRSLENDQYQGEVLYGKPHGYGILKYSNGLIFKGNFFAGHPKDGLSKLIFPSGEEYEGYVIQGKPNGIGIWKHQDGTFDEGTFFEGKLLKEN